MSTRIKKNVEIFYSWKEEKRESNIKCVAEQHIPQAMSHANFSCYSSFSQLCASEHPSGSEKSTQAFISWISEGVRQRGLLLQRLKFHLLMHQQTTVELKMKIYIKFMSSHQQKRSFFLLAYMRRRPLHDLKLEPSLLFAALLNVKSRLSIKCELIMCKEIMFMCTSLLGFPTIKYANQCRNMLCGVMCCCKKEKAKNRIHLVCDASLKEVNERLVSNCSAI